MTEAQVQTAGSIPRRHFLKQGVSKAATLVAAQSLAPVVFSGCIPAFAPTPGDPVKVGLLNSETGPMATSGGSVRDAGLMAIEEINARGGVLGRKIEAVVEDGKSRFTEFFPRKARKLLLEDQVVAVFGCWTSSGRKAVLPIFEEHNGLLFYPVQYEGNESSRNIVYSGAVPNQQILPAVDWLMSRDGGSRRRMYLLGSDYVYPRTANYIVTRYLQPRGGQVVAERYTPLGHRDFKAIIDEIRKIEPDVIFNTINGSSNIAFYNELAAQRVTPDKIPVVATSVGEVELRGLLPASVAGHLAALNYFQSVGTPANQEFVQQFQREHGWDRVTDDPMEAAYTQLYLWKLAAEKAGSFDANAVRESFREGIEYDAPGGRVRVDPKTQHTYKRFRMGKVRSDRQFDIVFESPDWIEPDPYPQVAFPGWSCDWTAGGVTPGAEVRIGS